MEVKRIQARPLTEEAFGPFGEVIGPPLRPPDIESPVNKYWDHVVRLEMLNKATQIGFLTVHFRELRFHQMERHLQASQAFIPLRGQPSIIALAPAGDISDLEVGPNPEEVTAFLLDGSVGINLARGTWHHLIFPLAPSADFVMILREHTMYDDMHMVNLLERWNISFEIVLLEWGGLDARSGR
ncbi:MAG: ureidoglycolate lyase [Chloroflexi bacterium]|nr:ureidoglycolate lyase [Chloroflexota bacterium]